jgi:serine/threonine protein kinase
MSASDAGDGASAQGGEMSRRLEEVIRKLLSRSPEDRYQSAADLSLALRPLERTASVVASSSAQAEGERRSTQAESADGGGSRKAISGSAKALSWPAPAIGLEPGTVIGRYVIVQSLGRGGMGAVMLGFDTQLARRVAIKVLLTRVASEEARLRMLREAQTMARLSHPNVVDIYDVGTHEGNIFLAMRYVEGITLQQWLATRRSRRDVLKVMKQAGRGLAAAHAAGIVHRDFKPDNVLVTKAGHAWVLDFGIARSEEADEPSAPKAERTALPLDAPPPLGQRAPSPSPSQGGVPSIEGHAVERLTQTGTILGTVGYFAPETAFEQKADPRSDVYSFCVTLWRCLYGRLPFPSATINEYARAIADGPPKTPRDAAVPEWLAEIVHDGLHTDPAKRHESMNELLRALEEADPDAHRSSESETTIRRDLVSFELTFRSNVELVPIVRRFVADFYDRIIRDPDATSRIVLATHELLENAVKYAISEETRLLVEVDRSHEPVALAIRTWNTAGEDDIAAVDQTIAAMNAHDDPARYYYEQMSASLERDRSGLGLARVAAEGEMSLSCERDGNRLCVIARRVR